MNKEALQRAIIASLEHFPARRSKRVHKPAQAPLCASCGHDKHVTATCAREIWKTVYTNAAGKSEAYAIACQCKYRVKRSR